MENPTLRTPPPRQDEPVVQVSEDAPPYDPPRVLTLRGDDILRELGPAQACSFNHSVLGC